MVFVPTCKKYRRRHEAVTLLTEAGAAVNMQARAQVAFTVVGASGVNTSVLAASIMDLAFINICREGGEKRERQKQAGGERRETNECNLSKSSHYERKIGHKNKAQLSCQAERGI